MCVRLSDKGECKRQMESYIRLSRPSRTNTVMHAIWDVRDREKRCTGSQKIKQRLKTGTQLGPHAERWDRQRISNRQTAAQGVNLSVKKAQRETGQNVCVETLMDSYHITRTKGVEWLIQRHRLGGTDRHVGWHEDAEVRRCRSVSLCLQHYKQYYVRMLGTASHKASALLKIRLDTRTQEKKKEKKSVYLMT